MKKVMLLIAAMLILSAGNALAIPLIDGSIGINEWSTGLILDATDPNEVGAGILNIPDNYDLARIQAKVETGAGAGLYMMWQLYGTPTFTQIGPLPVVYWCGLDMNQNGVYTDSVDRIIDYRSTGFNVYDGTLAPILGTPVYAKSSVVEFYIPSGMFASFPDTDFDGYVLLDNGGSPADDNLPDTGYFHTPEPGSIMLLGMGLIGFAGSLLRKKFMA